MICVTTAAKVGVSTVVLVSPAIPVQELNVNVTITTQQKESS